MYAMGIKVRIGLRYLFLKVKTIEFGWFFGQRGRFILNHKLLSENESSRS